MTGTYYQQIFPWWSIVSGFSKKDEKLVLLCDLEKRLKLSICQVNGVGKKLPKDWENRVEHILQSVAKAQFPRNKEDSNYWLPGATEDKVENTDNFPTWMEAVFNVSCGFHNDNQHHVVTIYGNYRVITLFSPW